MRTNMTRVISLLLVCAACGDVDDGRAKPVVQPAGVTCAWTEPLRCNTCACEAPGAVTEDAVVECDYAAKVCQCTTMFCVGAHQSE